MFPSPAFSHSDSTRASTGRAQTRRSPSLQRLGPQQLDGPREQTGHERLGRLRGLPGLDLELSLTGLHLAGAKPVTQPALVAAQPALILRPALIPSPAQPSVELILHGALDDQPGAELGRPRQRLPRVLATPTTSSRSICASIPADGGLVRPTA